MSVVGNEATVAREEQRVTALQVLQEADGYWGNSYSREEKLQWLSHLDGQIHEEILRKHLPLPGDFVPYKGVAALHRKLLVPEPYGRQLYLLWLESRMAYFHGETEHYNNALEQFRSAYTAFARWYHGNHELPRSARKFW